MPTIRNKSNLPPFSQPVREEPASAIQRPHDGRLGTSVASPRTADIPRADYPADYGRRSASQVSVRLNSGGSALAIGRHEPLKRGRASILDALERDYRSSQIMLFGEATHDEARSYALFEQLLARVSDSVDFVGFEIEAHQQGMLDQFMAGSLSSLNGIAPTRTKKPETIAALESLIRRLAAINDQRRQIGRTPIKVVALDQDKPATPGAEAMVRWFLSRDEHMHDVLGEIINAGGSRGLVFSGAAHLARTGFPVPGILKQMGANVGVPVPDRFNNLGARLASTPGLQGSIARVWVQPATDLESAPIPPGYRFIYNLGRDLDPGDFVVGTKATDVIDYLERSGIGPEAPFYFPREFDRVVGLQ